MGKIYWTFTNRFCCLYIIGMIFGVLILAAFQDSWQVSQSSVQSGSEEVRTKSGQGQRVRKSTTSNPLIVSPQPVRPNDMASILNYHEQERKWCMEKLSNHSNQTNWCPCVPKDLQGRVLVNKLDNANWTSILESVGGGGDVRMGGEWLPDSCVPHMRLAIIIPCRDRDSHLRILLRHLYPILKRQQIHFRVFVVDQRRPAIFNKAAIMNIAFLEAQKRFHFDCAVFHDVDMLLEDDRALITCGPNPRHYARAVDRFGYSIYPTFGGVVSVTPQMFLKVNGFALRFFGWGGEDDDMWGRLRTFYDIYGPTPVVSRYSTVSHSRDVTNDKNGNRHGLIGRRKTATTTRANRTYFEGLSDLIYSVNSVQLMPLYTRIEADINTTNLDYPEHRTSQYRKVSGVCLDSDRIVKSTKGVSWASCRFQCDVHEQTPCFGFSNLNGRCHLIANVCKLVALKNSWTFVKDVQM